MRLGSQRKEWEQAGRDEGPAPGVKPKQTVQDKWRGEAKTHFAKTVCTAGVWLWRAKNPALLVLGNFTLGPSKPGPEAPRRLLVCSARYPSYCSTRILPFEGRFWRAGPRPDAPPPVSLAHVEVRRTRPFPPCMPSVVGKKEPVWPRVTHVVRAVMRHREGSDKLSPGRWVWG